MVIGLLVVGGLVVKKCCHFATKWRKPHNPSYTKYPGQGFTLFEFFRVYAPLRMINLGIGQIMTYFVY